MTDDLAALKTDDAAAATEADPQAPVRRPDERVNRTRR
jgi:hypothetical protein